VTFNVSGSYPSKQITMTTSTSGATIFYTTNNNSAPADPTHTGSTPGSGTSVYRSAISVPAGHDQFYKAIAYKSGLADSVVSETDVDNTSGGGMSPMTASSSFTSITYSVWDGDWALLEEYDKNGNLVEKYLQGYHGLVKTFQNVVYYYQDELGSTSHIAGGTGALIESYQYDLYGKPRVYNSGGTYQQNATPQAKDLGNGGARWMPELGLYDNRNRFMSPDLGRFLQPDPIGFKGDASNLYRYCGNDWASKSDLLGLDVEVELRYYMLQGSFGHGHQNLVIRDTITGQVAVLRGIPSEPWRTGGSKGGSNSMLNLAQKTDSGHGNVLLKAPIYTGCFGNKDPLEGKSTKLVPGSKTTLRQDFDAVHAKLEKFGARLDRAKIDYHLQSTNSNAAAGTGYQVITGERPPCSEKFPGSQLDLRSRMGIRVPVPEMSGPRIPPPPQASHTEPPDGGGADGWLAVGTVLGGRTGGPQGGGEP
jgi:RHS repeat-associated protein